MASMDTPAKRNEMGWRGHNMAKYELLTKCLKIMPCLKKAALKHSRFGELSKTT